MNHQKKKSKRKSRVWTSTIWTIAITSLIVILALSFQPRQALMAMERNIRPNLKPSECNGCAGQFSDGVSTHEKAYRREGIKPKDELAELKHLEKKGTLVRVRNNSNYHVAPMAHSVPLLMPKAKHFLDLLGNTYRQKCKSAGISYHPFKVTSMTRSRNSVDDLQKENKVAIKHSAHLKGKTLDISYTSFAGHQAQLDAFVAALSDLRKQKKCYVKYEETTGCLHITAR